MTELNIQSARSKKTKPDLAICPRIDMTPMVDLGFLLITFFIFTTTMSVKTTMKLYMPHDGDSTSIGQSKVLTVLLGNHNKLFAYEGAFEDALKNNKIVETSYDEATGIGRLIRKKQDQLQKSGEKNDLLFLIRPTRQSTYKNLIDALDETTINSVKKYMILDPSLQERQLFKEGVFR